MSVTGISHLRIVSDGVLGHQTRVFFVARDGTETEISDVVKGISLNVSLNVSDLNTAELSVVKVKPDVRAIAHALQKELVKAFAREGAQA